MNKADAKMMKPKNSPEEGEYEVSDHPQALRKVDQLGLILLYELQDACEVVGGDGIIRTQTKLNLRVTKQSDGGKPSLLMA